ncbi:hypothetical protein TpMuguga_02g00778 [Theileria parva strain Muguga]|uniref:Uncharacterized protein n=1 Tax=Theileria parva TaxID=5875 RepID=Q4N461_THEPA|nr:uncharacterized protein TpMuguga_02g00778 [Theileria parva strain Muguga]EAN33062.1 hypothetical protein TpMuguga_02g00778 [Theileria parva strain Muguga]|eukprot:XP_765345.1 hypothetical protein [Theileria parva strain Muguga]
MFNKVVKGDTDIWETNDPTKYASKVFTDTKGENVSIYQMDGDIIHYGKSGAGWVKTSHKVTLDISKTSSTIEFDFHHDGERRTFTPKPGYFFSRVIISDILQCEFWEPKDPSVSINKVVIFGVESTIRNVSIFLSNNTVEHFHKEYDEWVAETAMILNIDINHDNDLFDYRSTRGFGHFNPKANLTVEKIVKKTLEIWKADPEDHGLKVVLMGAGKEEKHISILLESGEFVLLQKTGKGQPWGNITKNKHNFSGVKMFALEEGKSNYHELTREDYDPIVFECRYGYEFRNDVRCVRIINTFLSSLFKSQLITTKYYQ